MGAPTTSKTAGVGDAAPANTNVAGAAIPALRVGSFTLRSRLVVGTGKYRDHEQTRAAIDQSELATAASVSLAARSS
mgnify:CR=1 FL=1